MTPKHDAERARALIDEVCREIAQRRRAPVPRGFLRRVVRPAGLGLLIGLGAAGLPACDTEGAAGGGDAVFTDARGGGAVDIYGLPWPDVEDVVIASDVYGIPAGPDAAVDVYGIPGGPDVEPNADEYGIPFEDEPR